jgi:hypothetical protein
LKKGVALDNIEIVVADAEQAAVVARSLRWSWPQPLDFGPYRSFRREGFVGRSWLFEEVRAWAMTEGAAAGRPRAQLIEAEYGVGKSAFLAELVDTQAAGIPVVAQHFCQFDAISTLAPGRFVSSIAAQLAAALPAYRDAIEAVAAAGHQRWACRCYWLHPHEARSLPCGSLPQLRTAQVPQRRH